MKRNPKRIRVIRQISNNHYESVTIEDKTDRNLQTSTQIPATQRTQNESNKTIE